MPSDYLHNHKEFSNLLSILEDEIGIQAGLIEKFKKRYKDTSALYYNGQPEFENLLDRIKNNIEKL